MIYANDEKSGMYDSLFMDNYLNPAIGKGLAFLS